MRWNAIYKRIEHIKKPVGVEIGVYRGELSCKLLSLHAGLTLHMVDAWSEDTYNGKGNDAVSDRFRDIYTKGAALNYLATLEAVNKYKNRAVIHRMMSVRAALTFPDKLFDFVYIDAAHDKQSVIDDITYWLPKVKTGGYICGHDYGVDIFSGVKEAVDEMFTEQVNMHWDFPGLINKDMEGKITLIKLDEDFTWFVRV